MWQDQCRSSEFPTGQGRTGQCEAELDRGHRQLDDGGYPEDLIMRRLAVLVGLIATLAGGPLRQAEAAADFARSAAERFESSSLETPDGGVGDDTGEGTLTAVQGPPTGDGAPSADPSFLPLPISAVFMSVEAVCVRDRPAWPEAPPSRRPAWLQVFRF
jgi:hypothetical protein